MRFSIDLLKKCRFIAGPTACGKSDVALELAEQMKAEIVSMDSMAIYREMDIGTAKPSLEMQERVPHHLIDVCDPSHEFSVNDYVEAAEVAAREIIGREGTPLFVGGTGLYLRSLLRGVFEGPGADWEYRQELASMAREHGAAALHDLLREVDPESAERLHPNDERRVTRALEVFKITRQPVSAMQTEEPLPEEYRPRCIWLSPPREWLYERVNHRVDLMMEAGLIEEVRGLLDREPPLGRTARQGLGYKEIIECLEREISEAEAIEKIKTRTRQFAKRQHTWFRNLIECQEVTITGEESAGELVERVTGELQEA
ncbi:MAG: tRNA (adenosine(37)-N6)-dimethylallyltransferase MiaA [Planctomycetaceae bacterium]|nr:tRNA (adenosine(37)-N6)-dimethylallyltransferase MiaA [Planctomycetaceae bacterium]